MSEVNPSFIDAEAWFRMYGVIVTKEGRRIEKPTPTIVQKKMFAAYRECRVARRPCLMQILKPRQDGASTGVQAITYHHMRSFPGLNGAQMGDQKGTSDWLFGIFRRFAKEDKFRWPMSGNELRTDTDEDIVLSNGAHYGKETAGSTNAGRSGTVQIANATEVAFFTKNAERDPARAYVNSFYADGEMSLALWDTTPNGPSGTFYNMWQDKKNGWIKIFVAWHEDLSHSRPFQSMEERDELISGMDDQDREERARFNLTLEQMNWRRHIIRTKCESDPSKFQIEYPSDDVSCWLTSSRFRFSISKIDQMIAQVNRFYKSHGELTLLNDQRVAWMPDPAGTIEIYEEPRIGCRYLVAADTMTGADQVQSGPKTDPDYHSIGVWRAAYFDGTTLHPMRLVAHHWSRVESYVAANIAAAMSLYYGKCITVPEVNNCGLVMVKKLEELGIPIFIRQHTNRTAGTVDKMLGWKTDPVTRKTIIDKMAETINEWKPDKPTVEIPSQWILNQFRTFVRDANGDCAAMSGTHDDGVLQTCIAVYNCQSAATELKETIRRSNIAKLRKAQGWAKG